MNNNKKKNKEHKHHKYRERPQGPSVLHPVQKSKSRVKTCYHDTYI